jgi:hypothetical protein
VLSQSGTYRDIVQPIISGGASLHVLDNGNDLGRNQFRKKWGIILSMFSFRLLQLRYSWHLNDRVLLVGWQAIPILGMIKLGLIKRPKKILVMGCFVHDHTIRYIINKLLWAMRFKGLGFITFSQGESENLIKNVGILPSEVYFHLWRQDLDGKLPSEDIIEGDYVFSGGYSNRDYGLLISSMHCIETQLIIAASSRNQIKKTHDTSIKIYRDINESVFEKLLAQSKLVVLPLYNKGEACGQSVLLRVLRNGKPLIVTRHESVENYLGTDYPGFVKAGDRYALQKMIQHALCDSQYRNELSLAISKAAKLLEKRDSPANEILGFMLN